MSFTRRQFLGSSAAAVIVAGTMAKGKVFGANEKIGMGVIGFRGRGGSHIGAWTSNPRTELVALCDVDKSVLDKGVATVSTKTKKKPKGYVDLRKLLDNKSVDAVSIATPNHWHSLAAVWACEAGKDVYVEKPCSHNVWEGRQLVNAARKYGRIVQHGTQIRSSVGMQEAMQKLRDGVIGEVYMARGLCYKSRDSIGKKADCPVPKGVDYNLWLGPAPEHAFNPNRFHYNWHYCYDYGNGDMGNQGVHQMDIARWGLGVALPKKVTAMAGMYIFDDDKEVPNVSTAMFSYPDAGKKGRMLVFETRPWYTNDEDGAKIGVLFYGSEGYMVIDSYSAYRTFLGEKKEPGPSNDKGGDHYGNFLDAIQARDPKILNAEVLEGHYSAALCHLGLLSFRIGRSFDFDPEKEQILNDAEADAYLTRKYRVPFVVPKIDV
ncbi:MAG: Gfo/Idh/MocA family oxidoreductase [Candidatus Hydrogenedentes bacterium]|nr:Gfo/Idh/MocA family oxidoreductase [Candidatus Hydrogenedentota bacterium]